VHYSVLDWFSTSNVFTPSQYRDTRRADGDFAPLKRLMLAILEDAITTFQKTATATSRNRRRAFLEVDQWLQDRRTDGLFSFEEICCTLGISASSLRRALGEWRARSGGGGLEARVALRRRPVMIKGRLNPTGRSIRPRRKHRWASIRNGKTGTATPASLDSRTSFRPSRCGALKCGESPNVPLNG